MYPGFSYSRSSSLTPRLEMFKVPVQQYREAISGCPATGPSNRPLQP